MEKVININERRPHLSGEAFCILCKAQWVAVAEVGTVWLGCPECGAIKGLLRWPCERGGQHWHCNCGNDLFHIAPEGVYCPNCGSWQTGF